MLGTVGGNEFGRRLIVQYDGRDLLILKMNFHNTTDQRGVTSEFRDYYYKELCEVHQLNGSPSCSGISVRQ